MKPNAGRLDIGWLIATITFALLFIGMFIGLFYPEQIYVDLWVYLFLMGGLLFAIFAIFKWGKTQ